MSLVSLRGPTYLVQSDTANEWFPATPGQVEALKEGYRLGQSEGGQGGSMMWIKNEYTYNITTKSGMYSVYWRHPGRLYIGRGPGGKKRAVIYVPPHRGAAAARDAFPTAQEIGSCVTASGYTL